ncbi:MAG: GBS Bsp-like repeat-containing protein, partial [Lachnospiraceae bacterium]|nr:GBS Bsp-like repeat-containing protein [Lachnospiraceae bacterium]
SLLASYAPHVRADGTDMDAEGDAGAAEFQEVVTSVAYLSGTGNVNVAGKTPLDVNAFIAAMLDKCGKGYSQADRYSVNYYDCSSLVQRCLRDLGITENVPASTYYWDKLLEGCSVGEVLTFYGSRTFIRYRLVAKNIAIQGNEAYVRKPGTIMVFIAPGLSSGHICVSLGEFARQDEGLDPAVDRNTIIANTKAYVASQLEQTYGVPASRFLNTGEISGVCPIWLEDTLLGTDMTTESGAQSGPYNPIFRVEAYNSKMGVCVDNTYHGTNWTPNVRYVLEPIESEPVPYPEPVIEDISVSNVTSEGFRVTVQFTAEAGVRMIQVPVWTEANGQDDLIWYTATVINDNTAVVDIKTAYHNNESGMYIVHVYLTDLQSRQMIRGTTAEVPEPVIEPEEKLEFTWVEVTDVSCYGYTVIASFNSPYHVKEILLPTWTEANGQDDLIWYKATPYDNNQIAFYVQAKNHNRESGKYITHIYVRDTNGGEIIAGVTADLPEEEPEPFEIADARAYDITSDGYLVKVYFTQWRNVTEVLMPTWTEANGQDDLIWYEAPIIGDHAEVYVKASDHNNETGNYMTHVYVYNKDGSYLAQAVPVTVPKKVENKLMIADAAVTELTSDGYRVTAVFNAPEGVAQVLMPTWTEANGQDDLIWHEAEVVGNAATYYVKASDHRNESGTYFTHIYVIDRKGNQAIAGIDAIVPAKEVTPVEPIEPEEPEEPDTPTQAGIYVYNGLDYAPVFNPDYYLSKYPDLKAAFGTNTWAAFEHFIQYGISEGRQATAAFSVTAYRDRYADLQNAFGSNLMLYVQHYLTNGIYENRNGR